MRRPLSYGAPPVNPQDTGMRLAPGCLAVADALDDSATGGGKNPRTEGVGVRRIADPRTHILGGELRAVAREERNHAVAVVAPLGGDVCGHPVATLVSEFFAFDFRRFSRGLGGLTRFDAWCGE